MANAYVFLIDGQSNANFYGAQTVGNYSTSYGPVGSEQNLRIAFDGTANSVKSYIWNNSGATTNAPSGEIWDFVDPAVESSTIPTGGGGMGPENVLSPWLIDALGSNNIFFVRYAVDASALYDKPGGNWFAGDYQSGNYGADFMAEVKDALEDLRDNGHPDGVTTIDEIRIGGYLCYQGEEDSESGLGALQWEFNRLNLMAIYKEKLGYSDSEDGFPIGLIVPTKQRDSGATTMHNSARRVLKRGLESCVARWETDQSTQGFSIDAEGEPVTSTPPQVHVTEAGMESIWEDWFTAYDAMTGDPTVLWDDGGTTRTGAIVADGSLTALPTITIDDVDVTYTDAQLPIQPTISGSTGGVVTSEVVWESPKDTFSETGATPDLTPTLYDGHAIFGFWKHDLGYYAYDFIRTNILSPRTLTEDTTYIGTDPAQWNRGVSGATLASATLAAISSIPGYKDADKTVNATTGSSNVLSIDDAISFNPSVGMQFKDTGANNPLDETSDFIRIVKCRPAASQNGVGSIYGGNQGTFGILGTFLSQGPAQGGGYDNTSASNTGSLYRANNFGILRLGSETSSFGDFDDTIVVLAHINLSDTHYIYQYVDGTETTYESSGSVTAGTPATNFLGEDVNVGSNIGFDGSIMEAIAESISSGTNTALYDGANPNDTNILAMMAEIAANDIPPPATPVTGTASGTLFAITADSTGLYFVSGIGAGVLSDITGSAIGEYNAASFTGTGAADLSAITADATGTLVNTGTASADLSAITANGVGGTGVSGTVGADLTAITANALGATTVDGTAAGDLVAITASSSGLFTPIVVTGSGTGTLTAIEADATGLFTTINVDGTADATLQFMLADATGLTINPITGTAAGLIANITGLATGAVTSVNTGTAAGDLQSIISVAIGNVTNDATGTAIAALEPFTGDSTGIYIDVVTGTGVGDLDAITADSEGLYIAVITGTATSDLNSIRASGVGIFAGAELWTVQTNTSTAWTIED